MELQCKRTAFVLAYAYAFSFRETAQHNCNHKGSTLSLLQFGKRHASKVCAGRVGDGKGIGDQSTKNPVCAMVLPLDHMKRIPQCRVLSSDLVPSHHTRRPQHHLQHFADDLAKLGTNNNCERFPHVLCINTATKQQTTFQFTSTVGQGFQTIDTWSVRQAAKSACSSASLYARKFR